MSTEILMAIGGLGLFLIGMIVLTDSLRALAGGALRRVLTRFTTSPLTGAAAGAVTTAVIQSSSATTVTAVGFVGAGLLTFPQAHGVILGANVGTTITGWLVAIVGFKLQLGAAYHLWRIRHHLNQAEQEPPPGAPAADTAVELTQAAAV